MMKMRTLAISIVLLATSAFGADIDGKWAGSIETPGGTFQIAYDFKSDGAKLDGTTAGPDGTPVKIADGKIDGSKIFFNQTLDFGGMPVTIAYTGVISGTELKLNADFGGMPFEFVLKKS